MLCLALSISKSLCVLRVIKRKKIQFKQSIMDNSQSASFNAGQAQGQATVKKDQMVDKASNAAQSVKDSMSEVRNIAGQAGQTVMNKASGAADAVKDATGMKK